MRCLLIGCACLAVASGCGAKAATEAGARETLTVLSVSVASPPASASPLGLPLTGPPRLVIENHATADIELYGGYIVDEEGKLGTMPLWPHPSDCPDYVPKQHLLPLAGVHDLGAPSRAFDSKHCAPGPELPPGRYVVHIDSGFGTELYAGAAVELPLLAPVRLEMKMHEAAPACTPLRARRAARLAFAAAKARGVDGSLLDSCRVATAECATLPLTEEPPPASCTLKLHEQLFRARFAPNEGQPKELTVWLDPEVVLAQRPGLSRSTAAAIVIAGRPVVFEALTERHWHVHGGDAARIGSMRVRVFNQTARTLPVTVTAVEWQTDHSCGKPAAAKPGPRVTGYAPKSLAPGMSELAIEFGGQQAYQAHCDVFASRATLTVEGHTVSVVSEHEVGRFEPLDAE